MLCSLRGTETSSVVEEKLMLYAVNGQLRIDTSSNNGIIWCAKQKTELVFAEPFVKANNANSL